MAETDDRDHGLERKLATILSADVAGYSRLMAEDEEHALRTFRGHKEVFEKLVALHRGRVFNTAGDAILGEFGSAVEAVRCATEIQAALRTRNDQLPDERRVEFRIGVNLGDVMVQGQDLLGDGVNVAARLQSAAVPGGICISGSVYDQIRNKLSLSFKPLGDVSYKNIPQTVRTFAIAEAEGLGALPSPVHRRQRTARGLPLWPVIAAALLLIAAGAAAFWAYSERQRSQAEFAREAELASERTAAEQVRQRAQAQRQASEAARLQAELAADTRAGEGARQRADTERQAAEASKQRAQAEQHRIIGEGRRLTEENRKKGEAAQLATAAMPAPARVPPAPLPLDPPRTPPAAPKPGAVADPSGLYRGPICYGPAAADPARCFRAQAAVLGSRISGQWPARGRGATMYLAGDISPSGEVVIHMHAQRTDGSRFAVIDLIGTLRDGRIDASGGFRNGRHVTINWLKD